MSYANTWPAEIPLPLLDYQGRPAHPTIASGLDNARLQRRARWTNGGVGVALRWMLTVAQYDAFRAFFEEDLGNGTAAFLIELRYPQTSALTSWLIRFVGQVSVAPTAAMFEVTAEVFLIQPEFIPLPPAPPLDFEPFLVIPPGVFESGFGSEESDSDSSSAPWEYEPFLLFGNQQWMVKIS